MPDFCAAYGCSNQRSLQTRRRGITFHKFPKSSESRRQWELAIRRDGFVPNDSNREPTERRKSCKRQATDHQYALPACPKALKAKLTAAFGAVRKLQREKSNALAKERRAKRNM
ncbi:uncharacterized protein ACB057_000495 [Neosynchiropus ocellatus]